MDEAEKLCDDLVIIDKGKIIAQGSPESLINEYFKDKIIEFKDVEFDKKFKEEIVETIEHKKISFEEKDDKVLIYSDNIQRSLKSLFQLFENHNLELDDVLIRKATLEDVFLKLTGRVYTDENL
jgi:ABC-type multidrug transport system ATPase subunit